MHHLGHEAYDFLGNFNEAMAVSDEICNSGFVHGLIEAQFTRTKDVDLALKTTCPDSGLQNFRQWQCYHGVGHGIMYFTGKNLSESLKYCEKIPSKFASDSCIGGTFMEYFIVVSHTGQYTADASAKDISECSTQMDRHKGYCYLYAPTAFLELNPNKYLESASVCEQAESRFISGCIAGVGSQAIKENITNPSFVAQICKQLKKQNYTVKCIEGATGLYINHHGSLEPAVNLCKNAFKEFTNVCEGVITKSSSLFRD
jgi:hypothetical protein